ncbi:hypothetical protein I4U23_031024 [Adineta vaga]|nr:hypothetical protein I4U23_031024 [Adineta vaga]
MRNGSLKKINVVNDGGPRSCDFLDENLKFYEVHHRLRKFFNVENYHHKSVLYNFKIEPLQFKKYKTFGDYLDRYGLSGKDSALYLCTFEGNIDDRSKREIIKKRPSTRTTTTYPSASQRTQLNPFQQSWTNNQQSNPSSTTTNSNSSVTTQSSASEYSFEHACDDLKELVRELINQNNSNQIVIQLHGNIYSTYGLIVAKIQPLNEQLNQIIAFFETLNDANMISYSNDLNNAVDSSQSIMDLLQLNKEAFERVQLYQRIFHTFSKFDNELKLHYKWLQLVEKHKHRTISSGQQELSFRDRPSRIPNAPTDPFAHFISLESIASFAIKY